MCLLWLLLIRLRATSAAAALILLLSETSLEGLKHVVAGLLLYMCEYVCTCMYVYMTLCVYNMCMCVSVHKSVQEVILNSEQYY